MNIRKLGFQIDVYKRLQKISKSLTALDEYDCNFGNTPKQIKRCEKLEQRAEELAQLIGLHAYHQSDPRGCSLHLVPKLKDAYLNYSTNGVAVY